MIDEAAVCFIAIEPIELSVRGTNREIFRELSICDKVLALYGILPVNRERVIASPLAAFVYASAVEAAGAVRRRPDACEPGDDENQEQRNDAAHRSRGSAMWH